MPFAPVVLRKNADKYIKNPKNIRSPYMMIGFDTKENYKDLISAVHPADKSARPQILEEGQNPQMEEILDEFERITGRSILLNTSFNLRGEPIVQTPQDAFRTFSNSSMDMLVLGNFIIQK